MLRIPFAGAGAGWPGYEPFGWPDPWGPLGLKCSLHSPTTHPSVERTAEKACVHARRARNLWLDAHTHVNNRLRARCAQTREHSGLGF
jgi:hypothetical protein